MKLIAAAILVLGGGYIGILFASGLAIRVNQIEEMRLALMRMSFNISFLKMPVKEALASAAKTSKGGIYRLLVDAADMINNGLSPGCAWERAILKNRSHLCLKSSDTDILNEFANNLGRGDTENEINNIKATCAKLSLTQTTAEGERDSKGRVWKGAGVLAGMFVAVLLF